jgi:hypothetical protein
MRKTEGGLLLRVERSRGNAGKRCGDASRTPIERVSEGLKRLFLVGGHSMIAAWIVVVYLVLILTPCLIAASVDLEAEERNALVRMEESDRG